jgi:hypothetical protein
MISVKGVHPLKSYEHTKRQGPTSTGSSFVCTPKVLTFAILEPQRIRDQKYGIMVTFNGMTSLLNFIIIFHLFQMLSVGTHKQQTRTHKQIDRQTDGRTDRQHGDLRLTFLLKERILKRISIK